MSNPVIPESRPSLRTSPIPGWTVWQSSVGRQWHARKIGTDPAVLVHGDTLEDLRGQARNW
jgi:hypothetical protein